MYIIIRLYLYWAQVIKALKLETGKVPKDYEDNFRRADQTFLYQVVFDPRSQEQVRLNNPPSDTTLEFAGVYPQKCVLKRWCTVIMLFQKLSRRGYAIQIQCVISFLLCLTNNEHNNDCIGIIHVHQRGL